jgi:hypothetical protein
MHIYSVHFTAPPETPGELDLTIKLPRTLYFSAMLRKPLGAGSGRETRVIRTPLDLLPHSDSSDSWVTNEGHGMDIGMDTDDDLLAQYIPTYCR